MSLSFKQFLSNRGRSQCIETYFLFALKFLNLSKTQIIAGSKIFFYEEKKREVIQHWHTRVIAREFDGYLFYLIP